jgi:hypothetical protein
LRDLNLANNVESMFTCQLGPLVLDSIEFVVGNLLNSKRETEKKEGFYGCPSKFQAAWGTGLTYSGNLKPVSSLIFCRNSFKKKKSLFL